MAPRTRHRVGSVAPQDTALAPTHSAGLQPAPATPGARPGTVGPRAGTSPLPHEAAVRGSALQSPPAWRDDKPGQRGPTLGSRSLPQHQWVPRRSRFQIGRAGLTGKELACSNTPQPRNRGSPAWHSAAPSPAARSPGCPGRGQHGGHGCCWGHPRAPSHPTTLELGNRGENAKSLQFFEVALGRRGQGGKQFAAKSLHLICVTFRQPHQLWMPGKRAWCALRPARAPQTRTPHAKSGPTSP